MISQLGETSFDACLNEVGIATGTEYGLEELFAYLNLYTTMGTPYYTETSMDELKGFMGATGNTHYQDYRYITSADVWHYLEVNDAWTYSYLLDPDISSARMYGVEIEFVNRSVINTETGDFQFEFWTRPAGASAIAVGNITGVSLSNSVIWINPNPPYNLTFTDSVASFQIDLSNGVALPPLTLKWRWATSRSWSEVLIS
jgi:hypothetical protein